MYSEDRKTWLSREEARITKYQHQHRGLSFQKLFLSPTTDQKVNLLGRDNHIYKGSVSKIPEDQLPPDVDETSIDEESLYKEIEDMDFPPVPKQEPLGPSRRIGGDYTTAKIIAFAPVYVECTKELEETLVLGKDGGIYRTKEITSSKTEVDELLKKRDSKVGKTSCIQECVKPSLVLFQINNKPLLCEKNKKTLVEFPTTEIRNIIGLIKEKNTEGKSNITTDTTNQNIENVHVENDDESKKAKEIEMEDKTGEEQGEADSEISVDKTDEEQSETDSEISVDKTDGEQGETDSEISVDKADEEQNEVHSEISVDTNEKPSPDTEESSDVVETKETTEEPDSETISNE